MIDRTAEFDEADMAYYGLTGDGGARARRDLLGRKLGIGYGKCQGLFKALNNYGISREELEACLKGRGRESNLKNQGYCLQIFYILWNKIHILEGE